VENQFPQRERRRVHHGAHALGERQTRVAVPPVAPHRVGEGAPEKTHRSSNRRCRAHRHRHYGNGASTIIMTTLGRVFY
jgi:hypothetical protein